MYQKVTSSRSIPFWWILFLSCKYVLMFIFTSACRYGNANVWKIFTDLFDYFPLTALVCPHNIFPFILFVSLFSNLSSYCFLQIRWWLFSCSCYNNKANVPWFPLHLECKSLAFIFLFPDKLVNWLKWGNRWCRRLGDLTLLFCFLHMNLSDWVWFAGSQSFLFFMIKLQYCIMPCHYF